MLFKKKEEKQYDSNWNMDLTFKELISINRYCFVSRPDIITTEGYNLYLKYPYSDKDRIILVKYINGSFTYIEDVDDEHYTHLNLERTKNIIKEIVSLDAI